MNKLLLLCLLVLAPVSMATADLKLAVVDLGKAFDQYYKTKDAQARLQEKFTGYQKELQALITDYQRMGGEAQTLDKAASDPTLSAAARQDKATALNAKKQDLVNLGNKIQEMKTERGRELEEEKYRRHQEIVAEISKVINEYSGPQGYDLVLDKSSSSGTGISIVLYNSSKLNDITGDIIKLLNQSAPAPGGASPSGAAAASAAHTAPIPAAPAAPAAH